MAALTRLLPTRVFEHVSSNFSSRSLLGLVDQHSRRWVTIQSQETDWDGLNILPNETSVKKKTLNQIRNISRLKPADRNRVYNTKPFSKPVHPSHFTVRYHRRLLGRYGCVTGVNPGVCWPTKADLEDIKEYEKVAFNYDILEVAKREAEKVEAAEIARRKWDEEIAQKVAKLPMIKAQVLAKRAKAKEALEEAKAKREHLIQLVDQHFNYSVPHREEQFREELKIRAQQIKEQEKLARKAEREQKKQAAKEQYKEKLKAAETKPVEEAKGTQTDENVEVTEETKKD